jgi:hypothetical protein
MADTKRGRLGVSELTAATNTAVYEVTSAMDATADIIITNKTDSHAKVSVAIVDGAVGAIADEDYILVDKLILQDDTHRIEDIHMNADEAVVVNSSVAGVVVRVDGIEEDEAGSSVLPSIQKISESVAVEDFTDATATTGTLALTTKLPAGAVPIGWKATVTGGFTGDTSATMQLGVSGDADRFSSVTDQSVYAAGTVGAGVPADACDGIAAAQTVLITITSDSDFTDVKTDDNGAMTVELYYIATV